MKTKLLVLLSQSTFHVAWVHGLALHVLTWNKSKSLSRPSAKHNNSPTPVVKMAEVFFSPSFTVITKALLLLLWGFFYHPHILPTFSQ